MPPSPDRAPGWALAAATVAVFAPALAAGFVNLDDYFYVVRNARVRAGLSLDLLAWAFRTAAADNWHPLTYLSHALDVSLFGLRPWGHHLTSVLLHLANVLLLYAALRRMTRDPWRSALAAAVFAVHPLQVESVAWVSERKNLLSAFFCLLALRPYLDDADEPARGRRAAVLACFVLAVLAKAVAVVLPALLLLLDFWPLERWRRGGWRPLLKEKLPLFAAAAGAGLFALSQARVMSMAELPLGTRLANAAVCGALYVVKTLWPSGLSPHYPYYLDVLRAPAVLGALALLAALTAAAVRLRKSRPALLMGWLWFAASLAPMLGLTQVGDRSMADHYAYLPLIGLGVMAAWSLPLARRPAALAASAAVLALMAVSSLQILYWRDSFSLWRRSLAVNPQDPAALRYLGLAYYEAGLLEPAVTFYQRAVQLDPEFAQAQSNLGAALAAQGDLASAEAHLRRAVELSPSYALAHFNLARLLAARSDEPGARREMEAAARLDPGFAQAGQALGGDLAPHQSR